PRRADVRRDLGGRVRQPDPRQRGRLGGSDRLLQPPRLRALPLVAGLPADRRAARYAAGRQAILTAPPRWSSEPALLPPHRGYAWVGLKQTTRGLPGSSALRSAQLRRSRHLAVGRRNRLAGDPQGRPAAPRRSHLAVRRAGPAAAVRTSGLAAAERRTPDRPSGRPSTSGRRHLRGTPPCWTAAT